MTLRKECICLTMMLLVTLFPVAGVTADSCIKCHETTTLIGQPTHRNATCVDCHADTEQHISKPAIPPGYIQQQTTRSTCQNCHNTDTQHWQSSAHRESDVTCNDCHQSHAKSDPVLSKRLQVPVCLSCHHELKAELHLPSRHPIVEGKTTCTSCHTAHGSVADSMLQGSSVTDSCIGCHEEKRGPFLFEHEPVSEDCSNCHKPHGSVIDGLLNTRPPFLCQQCHMAVDHVSELPRGSANPNLAGQSCMNCHSRIHGSNHPSGARLTR
jgi:DmsE family decaheme c-type cytochrome